MPVLDASTLILLAKSDLLLLLTEETQINIPEEVQQEALARKGSYDALMIEEMIHSGKILVSGSISTNTRKRVQTDFRLEAGEAAAVVLAKESGQPVGTDDGPAIKAAKIMRVPFFTAVHVLLELHERGRINGKVAAAKLHTLQTIGRYGAQILEDARKRIKE